jgi:hypothetical protein
VFWLSVAVLPFVGGSNALTSPAPFITLPAATQLSSPSL